MAGFVAENAERRRAERKMPPFDRRQADPSRGEYASELAMREERDVALQRLKMGDEAIGAGGDLLGRFTARTTIPKHIPVRSLLANVYGAPSFVVAIVPLGQIRINDGRSTEPGYLARSAGWLGREQT